MHATNFLRSALEPVSKPCFHTFRVRFSRRFRGATAVLQLVLVPFFIAVMTASLLADELPENATTPGTKGYVSGQLIYALEGRPTPECHASTIVETNDGLAAAWFAGTEEKDPDVGIWFANHDENGWSKPRRLVDGSEGESEDYACWNPVLYQAPDADGKRGDLMLFYKVGLSPRLWWGALITSQDNGNTWSAPRRLGKDKALPAKNQNLLGPVRCKPVMLSNGTLLCGSSTENDGWKVHMELTKDLGKTWRVVGPIHDPLKDETPFEAIQPTILTHADGRLQILCRTTQDVVSESWSDDNGETWSQMAATNLPNPSAGIDAVSLKDGRQLLVYNPTRNGRHRLAVAVSKDGKSWKTPIMLEAQPGEFSYPAMIQAADGKVHITYTWKRLSVKHVVLDPGKI